MPPETCLPDDHDDLGAFLHQLAVQSMGNSLPPAEVRARLLRNEWLARRAKCVPPVAHGPEVLPRSTP